MAVSIFFSKGVIVTKNKILFHMFIRGPYTSFRMFFDALKFIFERDHGQGYFPSQFFNYVVIAVSTVIFGIIGAITTPLASSVFAWLSMAIGHIAYPVLWLGTGLLTATMYNIADELGKIVYPMSQNDESIAGSMTTVHNIMLTISMIPSVWLVWLVLHALWVFVRTLIKF